MLMDSSHLSNQPLILRVLRRVRDRTNKIREVVMMMIVMMMMLGDGHDDNDNGHDSDDNDKNGDDDGV
jgi:hypothetical protein